MKLHLLKKYKLKKRNQKSKKKYDKVKIIVKKVEMIEAL